MPVIALTKTPELATNGHVAVAHRVIFECSAPALFGGLDVDGGEVAAALAMNVCRNLRNQFAQERGSLRSAPVVSHAVSDGVFRVEAIWRDEQMPVRAPAPFTAPPARS